MFNYENLCDKTANIAVDAGKLAAKMQKGPLEVECKLNARDIVTSADKAVQEFVVPALKTLMSGAAFLCEEGSDGSYRPESGMGGYVWVVDPIDGTTNFEHGIKSFGVSIGLLKDGRPVMGVVCAPRYETVWRAWEGSQAYRTSLEGTKAIHVNTSRNLLESIVTTGWPYDAAEFPRALGFVTKLMGHVRDIKRIGPASIDICRVAQGTIEAYAEAALKPWDIAGGSMVLMQAGGVPSRWDGSPLTYDCQEDILAVSPKIREELLKYTQGVDISEKGR